MAALISSLPHAEQHSPQVEYACNSLVCVCVCVRVLVGIYVVHMYAHLFVMLEACTISSITHGRINPSAGWLKTCINATQSFCR